jgi:hypothetical protein
MIFPQIPVENLCRGPAAAKRRIENPFTQKIAAWLQNTSNFKSVGPTIADILEHCLNIPAAQWKRNDQQVAAALKDLGWHRDRKGHGKSPYWTNEPEDTEQPV